jgi:hypothetical protein
VGGDLARSFHELVGDPAQLRDLGCGQDVRHHDEPLLPVLRHLKIADHFSLATMLEGRC